MNGGQKKVDATLDSMVLRARIAHVMKINNSNVQIF